MNCCYKPNLHPNFSSTSQAIHEVRVSSKSTLKFSRTKATSFITKCEIGDSLEEFLSKATPDKGLFRLLVCIDDIRHYIKRRPISSVFRIFTPEAQNPAPEAEILQPGAEILCLGRNSHLLTPIIKGSGRSEIKIRFGHWKPKIGLGGKD
ncbi:sedoheptulose-1,7-bisphosphatase, chloroplastic [Trifolium repens]|nr:sedoheptulose-1,7-bisphosphatase, chloroplastic [Trifolium repens]